MRVLVVGGSKGIGKACVEGLLSEGSEVIVASRSNDDISHLPIEHIELDVTSASDFSALEDLDDLNGLIYCPGSINLKPFHRLKEADFQADLDLNVLGLIRTLHATREALKAGKGAVVTFSTVAVQQGMTFHSSIAVSKGAIEGLTRTLAAEWAPNIRVNAIAPSLTDTPLAVSLLGDEKRRNASAERHPLKAVGQPEDIAKMAIHLIGDGGKWITGQVFGIDGGMSSVR